MADLRTDTRDVCPRGCPNSFNFMQFLGKCSKIYVGACQEGLAPPPQGNPRSTTDSDHYIHGTPYLVFSGPKFDHKCYTPE